VPSVEEASVWHARKKRAYDHCGTKARPAAL
jgi:hypothetical protein